MAARPVTINGIVYPKNKKDPPFPATIVGMAWITGLGVGGGPVIPPADLPPGAPPGIWGGGDVPMPDNPIANVPGAPGYVPPEPPDIERPEVPKPVPPGGGWAWGPNVGWIFVPGSATPGPKK